MLIINVAPTLPVCYKVSENATTHTNAIDDASASTHANVTTLPRMCA